MINKVFLKTLRDKLSGGNSRSLHLNALPGRFATRLDLSDFEFISKDFATKFLKTLLEKEKFRFEIKFDLNKSELSQEQKERLSIISKKLNAISIENEDNFKELGTKTFGFGYPLLIKKSKLDPKKNIIAPLFIWQLDIVRNTKQKSSWLILRNMIPKETDSNAKDSSEKLEQSVSKENIHTIAINDVLLSFLKGDENISIPQIDDDILEDSIVDRKELIGECTRILKSVNGDKISEEILNSYPPILPLPEKSTVDSKMSYNANIHFGGVFGLFKTQKESIISDIDKIIEKLDELKFEELKPEKPIGTPYSAINTDPTQQSVLSTLGIEPKKIIQGPPGTGKSQTLTALIINALSNNLKCLIVCEKKTALDVIKNNLKSENSQVSSLAAVIEDINRDREEIVNSVRTLISDPPSIQSVNKLTYDISCISFNKSAEEIQEQHKLRDEEIYAGKTWRDLVGEYLKLVRISSYKILNEKLTKNDFKFETDINELGNILLKIRESKHLYKDNYYLNHPFEVFNDSMFANNSYQELRQILNQKILEKLSKIEEIEQNANQDILEYKSWLDEHYTSYYDTLKKPIKEFNTFASKSYDNHGEIFYKNDAITNIKIKLFSILFAKYRSIREGRVGFKVKLSEVTKVQQLYQYIPHSFIEINSQHNLRVYIENIDELDTKLDEWFNVTSATKFEMIQQLSSKNVHPLYPYKNKIVATEECVKQFILNLNEDKLFKKSFSVRESHSLLLKDISSIKIQVTQINECLSDFWQYYDWRKFFNSLSDLSSTVVIALIQSQVQDWDITFKSWYYHWLLSSLDKSSYPKDDFKLKELSIAKDQLAATQVKVINKIWSERQMNSINRVKKKGILVNTLYNKRGSKGERRNSLRKIVESDFELFTDFFPVLMVSPTVCSSILPMEEGLFDIVIFDEASQLRIEDTFPALLRGKYKIISGDSHQMPPSSYFLGGNALLSPLDDDDDESIELGGYSGAASLDLADSESLLVYGENSGYKPSYLDIHYRSEHPDLIEFSNHAFYGRRLKAMPAKKEYNPIEFISVNGIYQDMKNRDEALQVIEIIRNQIQPISSNNYPTVGVATFNLYQRNLILEEITVARQDPAFDQKMNDLSATFFVKNLENIQGDERDIIILSTTFGKRADGTFRQNFGPITQKIGYKLLNVIVTRAKHKVYVCCSIPQARIAEYPLLIQQYNNNGRGIFYAYLAYAQAVSEGNKGAKNIILKMLHDNSEYKRFDTISDSTGSESPFEDEVFYNLAERIGQNRIEQQYPIGGFRIDMVIKPTNPNSPMIALECDGAKYHGSSEAYAWDMFREKTIKPYGFIFHRIWSTNWWRSPEKEMDKLMTLIRENDKP